MRLDAKEQNIVNFRVLLESGMSVLGMFLIIFVFKNLGSIEKTLIANTLFFVGIVLGFSVFGYFFSKINFKVSKVFFYGYVFTFFSLIPFVFGKGEFEIYSFMFLYGCANGFYWLGINTMELTGIAHVVKEKYIAVVGFYRKILAFTVPAILSLLFLNFADFTYYIIFVLAFLLFSISVYFSKNIFSYSPEKMTREDVKHFWLKPKAYSVHFYYFLEGCTHMMASVLLPLAAFLILVSEQNVGYLNTFASMLSILLMYFGIQYRVKSDKAKVYRNLGIMYVPFILAFAFFPNFYTFIIFTIASTILLPQISVSSHNVTLFTMSLESRGGKDFFSNMILREVNLFLGRLVCFVIFYTILVYQNDKVFILSGGFILLAIIFSLRSYTGFLILKKV